MKHVEYKPATLFPKWQLHLPFRMDLLQVVTIREWKEPERNASLALVKIV